MRRKPGWYWIKRVPEEDWQPAYWGPCPYYPGTWRWRMANYVEMHRGRIWRALPLTPPA